MTNERKYAALPDLDTGPDVFETPELTEDASTASNSGRPESQASSYKDVDGDSDDLTRIERRAFRPDQARAYFSRSRVDARLADFSDKLGDPSTKGYRVSVRHRRHRGGGHDYEATFDTDDEDETLEQRIARLQREVEEVRLESEKATQNDGTIGQEDHGPAAIMQQLSGVLTDLDKSRRHAKEEEEDLGEDSARLASTAAIGDAPKVSPDFKHTLLKATALETRLTSLEASLGISTTTTEISDRPSKSILASISMLETQLSIVSATTAPTLDTLSRQINALIADTDRLSESNRAAAKPDEATSSARPRSAVAEPAARNVDAEQQSEKIKELHKALPSFHRVSPLLPAVIERLRTLRVLHESASSASSSIDALEQHQAQVSSEISQWRSGLKRVEEAIQKAGDQADANKSAIEQWVQALEGRAQKLE